MCDPLKPTHFAILSYDYGSVRKPVVFYWLFSLLFFGLSLLGLHWWEKDERARKRAAALAAGYRRRASREDATMVIAQQLIDASKDGGAAFIAFSIMVFLFAGSLFYMDRVRRKREDRDK